MGYDNITYPGSYFGEKHVSVHPLFADGRALLRYSTISQRLLAVPDLQTSQHRSHHIRSYIRTREPGLGCMGYLLGRCYSEAFDGQGT